MVKNKELHFTTEVILYPLLFLFSIVLVFWAETRFNLNFNYLGIYPREFYGLRGVFFGPFIHSDISHLFNNSVPLVVLSMALFYFYKNIRWKVMFWGLVLTGVFTWIIGRPATHIGASGVIYMLTAFLLFKGIFSKQYQLTALSFVVIFLYGSFIWYIFPTDPKISWEGHLSGFLVGFLFAVFFKGPKLENKKFAWEQDDYDEEQDPFLQQFDEDGNFIEKKKEEVILDPPKKPTITIRYILKGEPKKTKE